MDTNRNRDHALFSTEKYRSVDAELVQAEKEMHDAEEQLRLVHERRERKKKQGKIFG